MSRCLHHARWAFQSQSLSMLQTSDAAAQALAAVRALLDPTDERYEAQQGLAAAGALAALAILIRDGNQSVSAEAAQTTEQLLRHSTVVTTRCAPHSVPRMQRTGHNIAVRT